MDPAATGLEPQTSPPTNRSKLPRGRRLFVKLAIGLVVIVGGAVGALRLFAPREFKMIVDPHPPTDVRIYDDTTPDSYVDSALDEIRVAQTLQSMFVAEAERRVDEPAGEQRRFRFEFTRRGIGRMSGPAAVEVFETEQGLVWTDGDDF